MRKIIFILPFIGFSVITACDSDTTEPKLDGIVNIRFYNDGELFQTMEVLESEDFIPLDKAVVFNDPDILNGEAITIHYVDDSVGIKNRIIIASLKVSPFHSYVDIMTIKPGGYTAIIPNYGAPKDDYKMNIFFLEESAIGPGEAKLVFEQKEKKRTISLDAEVNTILYAEKATSAQFQKPDSLIDFMVQIDAENVSPFDGLGLVLIFPGGRTISAVGTHLWSDRAGFKRGLMYAFWTEMK